MMFRTPSAAVCHRCSLAWYSSETPSAWYWAIALRTSVSRWEMRDSSREATCSKFDWAPSEAPVS